MTACPVCHWTLTACPSCGAPVCKCPDRRFVDGTRIFRNHSRAIPEQLSALNLLTGMKKHWRT